jgi:hypothetical protein
MITSKLHYWTVENTGWSGGVSWFKTGGTDANPLRFDSFADAATYALQKQHALNDPNTLWRVVETTVERSANKSVTTKEWTEV